MNENNYYYHPRRSYRDTYRDEEEYERNSGYSARPRGRWQADLNSYRNEAAWRNVGNYGARNDNRGGMDTSGYNYSYENRDWPNNAGYPEDEGWYFKRKDQYPYDPSHRPYRTYSEPEYAYEPWPRDFRSEREDYIRGWQGGYEPRRRERYNRPEPEHEGFFERVGNRLRNTWNDWREQGINPRDFYPHIDREYYSPRYQRERKHHYNENW